MVDNTATPPQPPDGSEERIRLTVDVWKRKLLDLSGRNRALNFKPTKVSTLTIVDEQPAEVFRYLYVQEKPMRFKAAPEAHGRKGSETGVAQDPVLPVSDDPNDFEESSDSTEADFVPYDPSELDERHQDGFLQTTAIAEALDKSLRRIVTSRRR